MTLSRTSLFTLLACLFLSACGDDDDVARIGGSGGSAGMSSSGGASGSGGEAGGSNDTSAKLCEEVDASKAVAVSPDGKSVAFVSCAHDEPSVVVRALGEDEDTVLGPATVDTELEWLLDGKTVLFGSGDALFARLADASEESARIGSEAAHVDEHRAFLERVDKIFAPRLMVLETDTDSDMRRVLVYKADDNYGSALTLLEDPNLSGDLSYLSDSGRTLISKLTNEDGSETYQKIRTDKSIEVIAMPFGPADYVLAPIGLGDTHDFALHDDELVRVELETGKTVLLVPSGEGLLEGTDHIFDREDAPGKKYVYYIQNGDPTRRLREGTDEPLVLAEANAVAHTLSPDLSTLIYLSDGQLFAVPAEGGESTLLVEESNDDTKLDLAFSSSKNELGYRLGDSLYRVSLAELSAEVVATGVASASKFSYDGRGDALVVLNDGRLERVEAGASEPVVLRESVEQFWSIPDSEELLVEVDGTLEVVTP